MDSPQHVKTHVFVGMEKFSMKGHSFNITEGVPSVNTLYQSKTQSKADPVRFKVLILCQIPSHHTWCPKKTIGFIVIKEKGRKQPTWLSNIEPGAYERVRHLLKCKAKLLKGYCMNSVGRQAYLSKSQNHLIFVQQGKKITS